MRSGFEQLKGSTWRVMGLVGLCALCWFLGSQAAIGQVVTSAVEANPPSSAIEVTVRPTTLLDADAADGDLTLADLIEPRAWSKAADLKRHLQQITISDTPAVGEDRSFTREGLTSVIHEAEARLAAAGYDVKFRVPSRAVVRRRYSYNADALRTAIEQKAREMCTDCRIRVKRVDVAPIKAEEIKRWQVQTRGERLRGEMLFHIEAELNDYRVRSLPARVSLDVQREVPVLIRAVQAGERLTSEDVRREWRDLSWSQDTPATDMDLLKSVAARSMGAGELLWKGNLRRENLIRHGDVVRLQIGTEALQISTEGVAQGQGQSGDSVRVKIGKSGKILSGVVVDKGLVEIRP
ncbi:MAG TPA: flagellar basal body P-ring formation chaperone FlgA [Pseudobdellovibrionaceae bacterium]|nr:flagellar basal body P-ring formation chaperone FlgA [Pseudobdellovibrionaceae bacterium]